MRTSQTRLFVLAVASCAMMMAQQSITMVPRLIRFNGTLPAGNRGATPAVISIYNSQYDGSALWSEVQNVTPGEKGAYSLMLGSTRNEGLPVDLFDTTEQRWLEVEIGGVKQPRIQVGGSAISGPAASVVRVPGGGIRPAVTSGTAGYLGVFTNATDLGNSALYQAGNTISIGGTSSLGAMTLIGSAPSGDTAGMALYNSAGGAGASVSLDMYNTFANGGIPQAKIKALDDGAYSDHITFWTKNPGAPTNPVAERVRITSTGRVGIGTTNPSAALEINGSLKLSGTGSNITFPDGTTISAGTVGGTPPPASLQAIGQMRWGFDQRSTLTRLNLKQPSGMYWDGYTLWVANGGAKNLTRFNPATNSTVTLPATGALSGTAHSVCFDGENIWATIPGSNQVQAVSLSTEAIVATVAVGANPAGCAFDGQNIWVANNGNGAGNTVSKINARTSKLIGSYEVGAGPFSVSFDGTNVWVANSTAGTVSKLLASTGATLSTVKVGANPLEQAFDGTSLWVANAGGTITKIDAETLATSTLNFGATPRSLTYDGKYMWIVNSNSVEGSHGSVIKVLASTGECVSSMPIGNAPFTSVFDGANVWVSNQKDNTLSLVRPAVQ